MGKVHLKIGLHKRGLGLKKDCVMNMKDMSHEYHMKGGFLKVTYLRKKTCGLIWPIYLHGPCLQLM